jgi:hypothetical protein
MSYVNVRITRRVLWIGGNAYPLQNVARAVTVKGNPNSINNRYPMGCLGALFGVFLTFMSLLLVWDKKPALAIGAWGLVVGIAVLQLIVRVVKGPVYSLVVETSGATSTVLTGRNKDCLDRIVWEIMSAIENPGAEYQVQV